MALVVTLAAIAVIALARDGRRGGSDLNLSDLLPSGVDLAGVAPGAAAGCARGTLTGEVTHVRDGDTLEVAGIPIRLDGLAAPERGEPGGAGATAALRALAAGRALRCQLDGSRTHDRCAGTCYLNGTDIAAELVRAGLARDRPRATAAGGTPRPSGRPSAGARRSPRRTACRATAGRTDSGGGATGRSA